MHSHKPWPLWTFLTLFSFTITLSAYRAASWIIGLLSTIVLCVLLFYALIALFWKCHRIRDIIEAAMGEIPALLRTLLFLPFPLEGRENHSFWFHRFLKQRGSEAGPSDPDRPILLTHGYLGHSSNWHTLLTTLHQLGYRNVFTVELGLPLHSIRIYADKVDAKAKQIAEMTGRSDITLIGHSMGGLVNAYYATHLAPKGSVRTCITMGSPLHGTLTAFIGFGRCAKEMRYGCPFVQELQESIRTMASEIEFVHLYSHGDAMIIPNRSASLQESKEVNNIPLHALGHVQLLHDELVSHQIVKTLGEESDSR